MSLLLACLVAVLAGVMALVFLRGLGRYSPPDFGGPEPYENHRAALEILASGKTTMVFHPPGYAYLVALSYAVLPDLPLSMLLLQVFLLPLVVLGTFRLAEVLAAGPPLLAAWATALYFPIAYFACGFNSIYFTMVAVGLAALLAPPLLARASLLRSLAVGLAIGAAACLRPNFALVGVAVCVALWLSTRRICEFLRRAVPVAVAALTLFVGVSSLNPPSEGQKMRGGFGLWSGLLVATYQYEYQWWDWDWYFDDSYRGYREYTIRIGEIERETGFPITDPRSESTLQRAAIERFVGEPLNSLKKMLISAVRIWVLVPTQLTSFAPRLIVGLGELLLLGVALYGAAGLRRTPFFWLCVGILMVPTLTHMLLHVEPRYALPGKPFEVVFACAGAWRMLRPRLGDGFPARREDM